MVDPGIRRYPLIKAIAGDPRDLRDAARQSPRTQAVAETHPESGSSGRGCHRAADHHDGAPSVVHAMLADRAKQRLDESAMSAAANDEQLRIG